MSKGLGALQREILDTLADAKREKRCYTGGRRWVDDPDGPNWVSVRGIFALLPDNVFDLRASLFYLARRHNAVYGGQYVEPAFQSAFSRAVRGLVSRKVLIVMLMVPVQRITWIGNTEPRAVWEHTFLGLDGGQYIRAGAQRRFVTVADKRYERVDNAYMMLPAASIGSENHHSDRL